MLVRRGEEDKKENGEEISTRQQILNCIELNQINANTGCKVIRITIFSEHLKIWASTWDLLDHND